MSMFEIVAMVEKLGITYNVKVFWQLTDKPIEVKQLKYDGDVMETINNLPRDHYVHLYLEEVVGFSETEMDELGLGEVEMDEADIGEPEMGCEPQMNEHEMNEPELGEPEMDEHVMDEHESEVRLEFESDSEDEEYVVGSESSSDVSSFSDRENEIVSSEDEVDEECNVNAGLGSDEVDVQSESGHLDSLHSVGEADSDGAQSKPRFPEFNRKTYMSNPTLKVGLVFTNKTVLKEKIKMYGIKNKYSVKLKRNDIKTIQVTCKRGCTWVLWATPINGEDPNTGTTTVCKLDEGRFERLYLCMQAMKDGFKAGCRPIIGLDGCHLKGYYQGYLLVAVGIDADDSIYPIVFAVVESENQSSWNWFLEILGNDLEINNSNSFTFMTDRQKGLMVDVLELFPYSEHRTCVRHLYSNSKSNGFTGKTLKDQLWKAARATYEREFQSSMAELKLIQFHTGVGPFMLVDTCTKFHVVLHINILLTSKLGHAHAENEN
ncbi:hypothetical protein V6N13_001089 [Hibiscus sabdariffa]